MHSPHKDSWPHWCPADPTLNAIDGLYNTIAALST